MSPHTDPGELLPCPFCGGEAEIERKGTARQSSIIACTNCGCRLETGEIWSIGERWNARQAASQGSAGGEPVAWVVFAENGNIRLWGKDKAGPQAFADEKGLVCEPVFRHPAQASGDRGDLTKIAAECHRAKWQFDFKDEIKIGMPVARRALVTAFNELHRIGDMALKLRDASPVPSAERS